MIDKRLDTGLHHLCTHAGALCQFLQRDDAAELSAVPVLEIGQHRKSRGLEVRVQISLGRANRYLLTSRFMREHFIPEHHLLTVQIPML